MYLNIEEENIPGGNTGKIILLLKSVDWLVLSLLEKATQKIKAAEIVVFKKTTSFSYQILCCQLHFLPMLIPFRFQI